VLSDKRQPVSGKVENIGLRSDINGANLGQTALLQPTVTHHGVWLYFRFRLSMRDVKEMTAYRGVDVSYETIRARTLRFGPKITADLRRRKLAPAARV
jgi:transposase-like protein